MIQISQKTLKESNIQSSLKDKFDTFPLTYVEKKAHNNLVNMFTRTTNKIY